VRAIEKQQHEETGDDGQENFQRRPRLCEAVGDVKTCDEIETNFR
jgi:hypothetical protein